MSIEAKTAVILSESKIPAVRLSDAVAMMPRSELTKWRNEAKRGGLDYYAFVASKMLGKFVTDVTTEERREVEQGLTDYCFGFVFRG